MDIRVDPVTDGGPFGEEWDVALDLYSLESKLLTLTREEALQLANALLDAALKHQFRTVVVKGGV